QILSRDIQLVVLDPHISQLPEQPGLLLAIIDSAGERQHLLKSGYVGASIALWEVVRLLERSQMTKFSLYSAARSGLGRIIGVQVVRHSLVRGERKRCAGVFLRIEK